MASPVIDIYIYIYNRKFVPVVRLSWLAPARQLFLTMGVCDYHFAQICTLFVIVAMVTLQASSSGGTSMGNVVWQVRPRRRLIGPPRGRRAPCRGVWMHAPPENFVILDFLRWFLVHFLGDKSAPNA